MIIIKKYRCLNGEVVNVEKFDENIIIVYYNGKKYRRNKSIIGQKLFPLSKNTNSIKIGSIVKIKNYSTNEISTVKLCGVHAEKQYKRMGGSYYGNSVKVLYIGDTVGYNNGVLNVSILSPLGKSLLNKSCGDRIIVPLPVNEIEKYIIISIE